MLGSIFKTLDMNYENGLTDSISKSKSVYQEQIYKMVNEKLGVDAIYFLRNADGVPQIPLIYFAAIDRYDADTIAELHRLAWNLGDAPLLFVVTPENLLIYNNYAAPKRTVDGKLDVNAGLVDTIETINTLESERQLLQYHRLKLETGEFWRENADSYRFDIKNRVDTTLMNNLRFMRRILVTNIRKRYSPKELSDEKLISIVHALLGRSILTKYLEERKDKNGESVFPNGFFSQFKDGATTYSDVLDDKAATYGLFKELINHFNGDMFPLVPQEYDVITTDELTELKHFILGTTDFENEQLLLWPLYSFNIIPIQLISSIYELFFHLKVDEKTDKAGTYYTPYHLVSMLMDEVLPWEGTFEEKKILDPSCGSGIFLVEAYRRLIGKWMYAQRTTSIDNKQLETILQKCIYGVDLNEEAIRIASFSLSLVMCDYLEPRSIWETLVFPKLLGYNLFHSDFFSNGKFDEQKYDVIIGNPPWESYLTPSANKYIKETQRPIGDKQVAQAFSWKSGELCKDNGIVCLIMPSKGFLFNRSDPNIAYRKAFFSTFHVSVIINYSIFRKTLFAKATGPATAVIYSVKSDDTTAPVFYCTPKPTFTVEDRRRFLIEPLDICKIPRDSIEDQLIWKIAMWGTPRDLSLINKIETKFNSVEIFLQKNHMIYAEGIIEGRTKQKDFPQYLNWPLITTKYFKAFSPNIESQMPVCNTRFYRCTQKKSEAFLAPHLIFKQSPKAGRFLSSVANFDALFVNSFIGVHGDERLLKYLSIVLYSKVFVYYALMTSRRWLVERDELNVEELLTYPIPEPTSAELDEACHLYDAAYISTVIDESRIDEYAYDLYQLKDYERELIENAVSNIYDYFYVKGNSAALSPLTNETAKRYCDVLTDILQNSLGSLENIGTILYRGNSPLVVIQILFESMSAHVINRADELDVLLSQLDRLLLDERSGSMAVKRNVRVYKKDSVYIIKPNQSRYWSYSNACNDADEIYADIMRAWRENNERY